MTSVTGRAVAAAGHALPSAGGPALPAAWLVLRAEARTRWRGWLALALLVGMAGAVVLTAAAGAQRTSTAFPRLLATTNAAQVSVATNANGRAYFDAVARLPAVAGLARVVLGQSTYLVLPGGRRGPFSSPMVSADGRFGTAIDRLKLVAGRMYRSSSPDEVVVDPQIAAADGLRPGAVVRLLSVPQDAAGNPEFRRADRLVFRVAGVAVFSNQVIPVAPGDRFPELALTPAFLGSRQARVFQVEGDEALLRVRQGTDLPGFVRQLGQLARRFPGTGGVNVTDLTAQQAKVEQAIQPQADALALFAALAGLVALAVVSQLLGRQLIIDSADYPVLSALGMGRRPLFGLGLLRTFLVTLAGGCIAAGIAVAASPLMPIGPARLAEPDPGVEVNLAVLGIGLAAIVAAPLLAVAPVAWHVARATVAPERRHAEPPRPSRLVSALARLRGSPAAVTGVRMAFEPGRGRGAVPVRSALAGMTAAVTSLVAAAVFGASLAQLVSTPRLYGQDWDLGLSLGFGSAPASGVAAVLSRVPGVAGYAGGNSEQISVAGQQVAAVGIQPLRGSVFPTLTAGRAPATGNEIALGAVTMRQLGKHLGQLVAVQTPAGTRRMRIIGQAIFPAFGVGILTPTGLGDGAAVSARLLPPSTVGGCRRTGASCYDFFLIRFRPGTPHAEITALGSRFVSALTASGCPPGTCQALTAAPPAALSNDSRVRATPLALGALLAVFAVCMLFQVLLGSARRRRKDLAVLKALGFLRRQVSATVAWQSVTLAAVALLVGLPLGVAGGRWAWALFAQSAGIEPGATVPVPSLLAAIPVALVLAAIAAAGPAWQAARMSPAVALRGE